MTVWTGHCVSVIHCELFGDALFGDTFLEQVHQACIVAVFVTAAQAVELAHLMRQLAMHQFGQQTLLMHHQALQNSTTR